MGEEEIVKDTERLKVALTRSRNDVERLKVVLARSYVAHQKAGCTGCDLGREIEQALQTGPFIAGLTGPPTARWGKSVPTGPKPI
jgi:hypothetical protein